MKELEFLHRLRAPSAGLGRGAAGIVSLAVCLGLAACGPQGASEQSQAQTSLATSQTVSQTATTAQASQAQNQAVTESPAFESSDELLDENSDQHRVKPGASVDLASHAPLQLQAGVADVFNIELKTPVTAGRMHVNLTAKAPLNLMSELDEFDFDLAPDGQYQVPITLMADENGRYYLNLQIELTEGEQTMGRSLDVIVQVGPALKTKIMRETKPGADSDTVIELPAQEQIH